MEITNIDLQTVLTGQNVVFTETPIQPTKCINHREGSGIVSLKGNTSNCFARYLVDFSGNIAIPDGGTAGAISLTIALQGEGLQSTQMVVTPTATEAFFNVSSATYIDVPKGCCVTVSVQNTSTQAISVTNANLIVNRVA